MLSYTYIQAQIIVYVEEPPVVAGNDNFTYADSAGGWGNGDLNKPAKAVRDTLMLVDDGTAEDSLGCNILINDLTGKIAVVYRAVCEFGVKAKNAQDAGAVAVIIINKGPLVGDGSPVGMGPGAQGANVTIPVVMISASGGAALRAELDAGSDIIAFIGNKVGVFNNDLGLQTIGILTSKATANPALVSLSATEFNVPLGAWIFNYGKNDLSNVTLTVDITGADTYSATSSPVSIVSGDTVYVSVPTYAAASYSGLYHVNYTVNSDSTDDFIADNIFYAGFLIDSLASYAFIDSVTEMPKSSDHYRPSPSPTIFENCIHFRDANASRLKARGIFASGSGGAGGTMTGEYLEARIYEWNDVFTGLSDPAFPASPWTLNEVRFGSYTYSADLQREMVYIPFNDSLILTDDQRYLFCARTYSPDVYLGFDAYYNYNEVINYNDQPVSIVRSDGTEYATGFGTDITSSVSVLFGTGNTQFTTSTSLTSEPFCDPACDGWATVSANFGTTPYTYLWNDPLAQTTATATGLCNGTHTVIVSDNAGAVDTLSVTLSPPGTPPSFTISATLTKICNGDSTWLTASSVPQGIYAWSTGDSTQTIGVDSIGTYTVSVTNCGGTTVDSITINLPPPPTFSISATDNIICNGDSTWLSVSPLSQVTYSWSTGGTTQTIGVASVGTYTVTVTNCGGSGVSAVDSITINLPAPPVASISGNVTFCPGDTILLTAGTDTTATYLWSTGETTQSIYADTSKTYTLVVTNCAGSDTTGVTTVFEPTLPATITPANDTTVCGSITLNANTGASYLWSTGDTTQQIVDTVSGSISVIVFNVCGVGTTSDTTVVTVNPLPPAPSNTNNGGTLTSSSATGNQWYMDGVSIPGQNGQTYVPTQTGSHSYTVTVTDAITGCTSLPSNAEVVFISAINEINSGITFNIYPNPNNGQFVIELNNVKKENYLVEVRNIIGQLIYTKEIAQTSFRVNLSEHNPGVYFLSISNASGMRTEKLVVGSW